MKRKSLSLILTLAVCVGMAFSTYNPVKAESVHESCEHICVPNVEKEDLGYNFDDTYHWKIYGVSQ